jgi:hypothetical protein
VIIHLPGSPTSPYTADVSWADQRIVYLVLAALALMIALRFMKRALAPIGTLVRAVAAAAVVAFTIALALVLVAAAAFTH